MLGIGCIWGCWRGVIDGLGIAGTSKVLSHTCFWIAGVEVSKSWSIQTYLQAACAVSGKNSKASKASKIILMLFSCLLKSSRLKIFIESWQGATPTQWLSNHLTWQPHEPSSGYSDFFLGLSSRHISSFACLLSTPHDSINTLLKCAFEEIFPLKPLPERNAGAVNSAY